MTTVLPTRPHTNSTGTSTSTASRHRQPSLSSFPSSKRTGSQSTHADSTSTAYFDAHSATREHDFARLRSSNNLTLPERNSAIDGATHTAFARRQRRVRSQYPANSAEKHVEYILVASFDIDRGSIMEHQYPGAVGGDEHMLADLMLPDQTHLRSQDWTTFFLHKDASEEDDERTRRRKRRKRRKAELAGAHDDVEAGAEDDGADGEEAESADDESDDQDFDSEDELIDGPPLVYVLNLVNTKQDHTVKRGAIVKAMAICTRHSFLHIYKPLLVIALEQYFANPVVETLATLYDAVNAMDLSLMPKLNFYERFILQSSDAKDLFLEKFEAIIAQRMANTDGEVASLPALSPTAPLSRSRYGLPRDTHEFESVVRYANIPVPVKVPTALSPETVGDFSLIKLITTFSTPHSTSPQPLTPFHPHLTTAGSLTHPVIVLLNALLTQKRVIFLGHNLPSSEVAEAVLGACALVSGGLLRGFTRHAFPYTDLTKIDDLLKVPGFIAGVTNPAFAHKPEWWDLLCDLGTGRMRISSKIEQAPLTEGVLYFQQPGQTPSAPSASAGSISAIAMAGASLSAGLGGSTTLMGSGAGDATGDVAFMTSVLKAIEERHGENAIRSKFRRWVLKFTRLAAAFEELVYGTSLLQLAPSPKTPSTPFSPSAKSPDSQFTSASPAFSRSMSMTTASTTTTTTTYNPEASASTDILPPEVTTHGYVWPSPQSKTNELAANATRIEGWRSTRSYYNFIQDLTAFYTRRPVQGIDLQHLHDKLAKLRLGTTASGNVYLAICAAVWSDEEINQLLAVIVNGTSLSAGTGNGGNSSGMSGQAGQGLFYLGAGLFHPKRDVREGVAGLLGRVREHEAGRHFWKAAGGFVRGAWERVVAGMEGRDDEGLTGGI
ncbi:hypothetical protein LTR62_005347 [Meristemomyces frigidus]|uniref:UDENN domain-containing protein n=1 Tax=Meristemomyces frigidus TaxID=1508187 RepID=A0AAN7TD45_9PEZI|nr:hypothetical protein LTR62_005347 [Meristemomyces frigidus]